MFTDQSPVVRRALCHSLSRAPSGSRDRLPDFIGEVEAQMTCHVAERGGEPPLLEGAPCSTKTSTHSRLLILADASVRRAAPPSDPKASDPKASDPKASDPKASDPKVSLGEVGTSDALGLGLGLGLGLSDASPPPPQHLANGGRPLPATPRAPAFAPTPGAGAPAERRPGLGLGLGLGLG